MKVLFTDVISVNTRLHTRALLRHIKNPNMKVLDTDVTNVTTRLNGRGIF